MAIDALERAASEEYHHRGFPAPVNGREGNGATEVHF